jgi:RimJ/RimL family protein N-acetyltransferase
MLTGERVTLRPVREDDLPTLYRWRVDLDSWAFTTPEPPYGLTYEAYADYKRSVAGKGPSVVELAAEVDGVLVGRATLFNFDDLARSCEIGLGFGPEHRGKGYGREVIRLLVDFAFRHRNVRRVHLTTLATNEPALRCYRAAGFVEEGRRRESAFADGAYVDEVLMSVLASDGR